MQPVEKTVIDRAVRNVYRPFLADPDPAKMPILGDLYNELLKQPEPEAARIAAALELPCHIRIKGEWKTCPSLYMMLVGRPGLGKTIQQPFGMENSGNL